MRDSPTCACGCGRPVADGYATTQCMARAAGQLATVAELTSAARDVVHRLVRRDGGHSHGQPGSRPPIDLGAADRLGWVQNRLTTLVREIADERGVEHPDPAGRDVIVVCARWLSGQVEWMRHRETVDRFLADVDESARRIVGMANGPTPGRYAGPCGNTDGDGRTCGRDVTARPGASYGTCRACGAQYNVDEQQAWMRGEIEGYLARPTEIAGVLLRLGFPIGYSTIAAYVAKGRLIAHGHDDQDRPLFRIGDVMNLRMGAKAR